MIHVTQRASSIASRVVEELRCNRTIYFAWLVWFAAFVLLVRATLGGPDGPRYMSYVRSLVFDHDLLLMNELEHFGQRVIITSTGYTAQIANVGIISFWLPFYLMGLLSAGINGDVGSGLGSNYQLWLDFGDWVYGLLALFVMYRWASTRFPRRVAFVATLLVGLGSSFIYYVAALSPSYHTMAALLCALFFYLWDETRTQRTALQWFGLGLLLGLLISMAQYHAVFLVFPVSDFRLKSANRKSLIASLQSPILLTVGLAIPLIPQLIAWGIIFGNPFANPYTLAADWSGAHLLDVLFSSYHGLFFTAPILMLAVCGWLLGFRRDKALYSGALIALLGIAYSSATRIGWWAGVSFGARYFIGLTPVFVMGLAELFEIRDRSPRARRGWRLRKSLVSNLQVLIVILGIVCTLWTYGYFLQAFTDLASFSEYHSAQQWIGNQRIVAQHLSETLAAHWALPRSPTLLANLAGFALWSLAITRVSASWIFGGRSVWRALWVVPLALVPIAFSAWLLTTIPTGEAHKQQLVVSGYYEKNAARGEFDWEQFSNEYVERARYDEAIGETSAAQIDYARAIALWPVPTRTLMGADERGKYQPVSLKFGEQVALLGYRLEPATIQTARPLTVTLLWQAAGRLPQDYDTSVLLFDQRGQLVARTPSIVGRDPFPMTWWPAGLLMRDEHVLNVADVQPPSLLTMRVELFDSSARKKLPVSDANGNASNGRIGEVKRASEFVPPNATSIATLGNQISLVGVHVTPDGDTWLLTLDWRAEEQPQTDYTVFVHALDAQNHIIAQSDAPPLDGRFPTHAWSRGEVIRELKRLKASADVLTRIDHFDVGMYTPSDGERLSSSAGGDAIIIMREVKP